MNLRDWEPTKSRRRFTILPSSVGFEVIDAETGHPVDKRLTAKEAVEEAGDLNRLAFAGGDALCNALTALSERPTDPLR